MQVEKIEYQKAYVELYEIIKALPEEEQEKIPKTLLKNLKDNMSKEYKIETKALFVELYERYLAPKEEKNFWDKYDKICNNMIEEKKLKLYDTENIFKNKQQDKEEKISNKKEEKNNLPIEIKKENIIKRFLKFMRDIFNLR